MISWRHRVPRRATARHVDGPARFWRRTPVDRLEFAVIDTETSSADPVRARILQVAVVGCLGDGTILDAWSTLVRPDDGYVGPTDIHGLEFEDVVTAPVFEDVLPALVRCLRGRVLVAHNLSFDLAMLDAAFARSGYDPGSVARVDTLALARGLARERGGDAARGGHGLAALCRRFGVPLDNAHDALADATATAAVLPCLLRERGVRTLGDLVQVAPEVLGPSAWPDPRFSAAVRARVQRDRVAIPAMLRAAGRRRQAEEQAAAMERDRERALRVRFDRAPDGTWSVVGPPDRVRVGALSVLTRREVRPVVVVAVEPAPRLAGRHQVRGHLAPRDDG